MLQRPEAAEQAGASAACAAACAAACGFTLWCLPGGPSACHAPAASPHSPLRPLSDVQVNVDTEEMRELGQGMQVAHLPWFHLFLAGDLRASFSANVTSVATLRAEIAANKPCTDPACGVY